MNSYVEKEGSGSTISDPWGFSLDDEIFDDIFGTGSADQDFSLSGASDLYLRIILSIREEQAAVALKESLILPPPGKNQAVLDLLQSWLSEDEDEDEHRETFEFLKNAIDDDRTSNRKLFTEE